MKLRPFTFAVAAALFWLPASSSAQVGSTPAGNELLLRMDAAMQSAGSEHVTVRTGTPALSRRKPRLKETASGFMDISTKQQLMHSVWVNNVTTLATPPVTLSDRSEFIRRDRVLAQRLNGTWACSRVAPDGTDQRVSYDLYVPGHPQSVKTLRTGTVLHISVWWVRVVSDPDTTTIGPIDLAIAQGTYRLVRETLPLGYRRGNPGGLTVLLDYSRYGEPVNVELPQQCAR